MVLVMQVIVESTFSRDRTGPVVRNWVEAMVLEVCSRD